MSYVLTKDFVFSPCVPILFALFFLFFSAGVHFYLASCSLLTASISHFKIFSCCFSKKKVSLFIPRYNSFSVVHVSVDIKTQWETDIVVVFSPRYSGWPRDFSPKTSSSIWVSIPVD